MANLSLEFYRNLAEDVFRAFIREVENEFSELEVYVDVVNDPTLNVLTVILNVSNKNLTHQILLNPRQLRILQLAVNEAQGKVSEYVREQARGQEVVYELSSEVNGKRRVFLSRVDLDVLMELENVTWLFQIPEEDDDNDCWAPEDNHKRDIKLFIEKKYVIKETLKR